MIESNTATSAMMLGGVAPAKNSATQAPAKGNDAFKAALAGANVVRKQISSGSSDTTKTVSNVADKNSTLSSDKPDNNSSVAKAVKLLDDVAQSVSQDEDIKEVSTDDNAEAILPDSKDGADAIVSPIVTAPNSSSLIVVAAAPLLTTEVNDSSQGVDTSSVAAVPTDTIVQSGSKDAIMQIISNPTEENDVVEADVSSKADTPVSLGKDVSAQLKSKVEAKDSVLTSKDPVLEEADGHDTNEVPMRPAVSNGDDQSSGPKQDVKLSSYIPKESTPVDSTRTSTNANANTVSNEAITVIDNSVVEDKTVVKVSGESKAETMALPNAVPLADKKDHTEDKVKDTETQTVDSDTELSVATNKSEQKDSQTGKQSSSSKDGFDAHLKNVTVEKSDSKDTQTTLSDTSLSDNSEDTIQVPVTKVKGDESKVSDSVRSSSLASSDTVDPDSNLAQNLQVNFRASQVDVTSKLKDVFVDPKLQDRIDTIAQQLATRLKLSHAAGGSQIQLSLKPRELGDVTVQMKIREGVVAATVLVDRADAAHTIERNITDLKRALEQQGLSIQQLNVDVRGDARAGNPFGFGQQDGSSSRYSANGSASGSDESSLAIDQEHDRKVTIDDIHDGDVSVLI